ncbi:exodeoxyribonuclease III [Candidatus Woesearchaeota archaeon]|nr:exodeoxyribonuclease III [Candidatus Woesearchaeota archaeon]
MAKLVSWNVNGIRAVLKKGFLSWFNKSPIDILCIQETKAHKDQVGLELESYFQYWNSAEKKGYSGAAVFSKIKPVKVMDGMGIQEHDKEGRIQTLEFDDFFVVNVYAPNAKRGLLRLDYKIKWDNDFLKFLKRLEEKKPVIFCGDMNVAHREIDIARPNSNRRNAGFTDEEREAFTKILNAGFVDTFRHLHPNTVKYSWWSYMFNARLKNIGWRIDYFCVSKSLVKKIKNAFILNEVMGSDHCPVGIELEL